MAAGFDLAFSFGPRTKLSSFRESWDEFAPPDGLFTSCDRAAEEICPVWPLRGPSAFVAANVRDDVRLRQ
jgi:hypothetical protein